MRLNVLTLFVLDDILVLLVEDRAAVAVLRPGMKRENFVVKIIQLKMCSTTALSMR